MNIAVNFAAFIAVFLVVIWAMQRRMMYFPTRAVPAPAEIGITGIEPISIREPPTGST